MTKFVVNGSEINSEQPGDTPLLWVLREELGLTGTKFGCGIAQCGAAPEIAVNRAALDHRPEGMHGFGVAGVKGRREPPRHRQLGDG